VGDTMAAGAGLNASGVAEILCEEAPSAVFDLERWGAPFDRGTEGLIAQFRAAPGAFPRTCLAGPRTGHALLNTLFEQVVRWGTRIYAGRRVLSLVVKDERCFGVVAMDPATGDVMALGAKAVILAAGGCGQIYGRTSNALHCTGSGMAMAYRAGVPLVDMECVQFHPLAIAGGRVLAPQALLQQGHLLNGRLDRFMETYDLQKMEHAGSAVIARAMAREIDEGRAFSDGCVRLDLPDMSARKRTELINGIRQDVIRFVGMDPRDEPIPIAPVQRCILGGVAVDEHGMTCIRGLLAAGECACTGAHGAHVLAGNAIPEALVFGRRAGERAVALCRKPTPAAEGVIEEGRQREGERIQRLLSDGSGERPAALRDRLSSIMWGKVGIVRDEAGLSEAIQEIRECRAAYADVAVAGESAEFNSDLMTAIDVGEMIDVAEAVALSARTRRESRGVHYRRDHPDMDDRNGVRHTRVTFSEAGPDVSYAPLGNVGNSVGSLSGSR